MEVVCRTQAELEAAVEAGNQPLLIGEYFDVKAGWKVAARGNSQVTAWGNSRVAARGAVIVRVFSCKEVIATATVVVVIHGCRHRVTGGIPIEVSPPKTPREWCDYYGAKIEGEHAILFKGVGDDFRSPKGGNYTPGTTPRASDWDGGEKECGGGLHFSPHPLMTLEFNADATRFVACPVALAEIAVHPNGDYPQKVKAAGCAGPVWEVDRAGVRIATAEAATT